jgi:hypothetical protein
MSDLWPEGEDLRRAVRWFSEQRTQDPDVPLIELAQQAALRFDLSPRQAEYLLHIAGAHTGAPD